MQKDNDALGLRLCNMNKFVIRALSDIERHQSAGIKQEVLTS